MRFEYPSTDYPHFSSFVNFPKLKVVLLVEFVDSSQTVLKCKCLSNSNFQYCAISHPALKCTRGVNVFTRSSEHAPCQLQVYSLNSPFLNCEQRKKKHLLIYITALTCFTSSVVYHLHRINLQRTG